MLRVQPAGLEDVDLIQELAYATWPSTYQEILSPQQLTYMLQLIYSKEALTQQIRISKHHFILLLNDETPVGFASHSPKHSGNNKTWRLHKLYVLPTQQGKGSGKFLLSHIIGEASLHGASFLELNVNRFNKAMGFYERNGFVILQEEKIDIGEGYFMDDYIMQKALH